ncbi:MAG: CNNM domain-containing protein [Phycisphaerales bacterium]
MSVPELIIWIILALVGILGSAFCSGLEVGLYSVSRVLTRVRSVDQPRAEKLHNQLQNPAPVLTTLLVYNNAFNYLATLAFTALLSATSLSDTLIMVIQAAVLTPILLIFAESIPKELFRSRASLLMERLVPLVVAMRYTLTIIPITIILTFIATTISKLLGADLTGSVRDARQNMADLVKHADDQITQSQTEMIDRALTLNQTPIRTVMVPLSRVTKIKTNAKRAATLEKIKSTNHTRYPVMNQERKVIGCINGIDLYINPDSSIKDLTQPIPRYNTEVPMRLALSKMRAENAHLAIVTRSGHDVGLITRKDLLSPLIATTHDW